MEKVLLKGQEKGLQKIKKRPVVRWDHFVKETLGRTIVTILGIFIAVITVIIGIFLCVHGISTFT